MAAVAGSAWTQRAVIRLSRKATTAGVYRRIVGLPLATREQSTLTQAASSAAIRWVPGCVIAMAMAVALARADEEGAKPIVKRRPSPSVTDALTES
jgi:hypothetical protein